MSRNESTILIKQGIFVPIHLINVSSVKEVYSTRLYEDRACAKCENLSERHSYLCDNCPAYKGQVNLAKRVHYKGRDFLSIPVGDKVNFERKTGLLIKECKFKDLRVNAPFDYPIKFLATLRDYQIPVIEQFLKKKYGLLEAPPRTGKCQVAGTLVQTTDGLIPIEELVGIIPDDTPIPKIFEVNTKDGVAEVSHVFRSKSKTIRLESALGYSVEGTPEHKMWVLSNGELQWKELQNIELGDSLVVHLTNQMWAKHVASEQEIAEAKLLAEKAATEHIDLPVTIRSNKILAGEFVKALRKGTDFIVVHSQETERQIQVLLTNLGILSERK